MKRFFIFAVLFLSHGFSGSFYFYDSFTSLSADWLTNIAYGRAAGTVTPTTAGGGGTFTSCFRTAGNTYRFQDTPNNGTGGRNGYWMGRYLMSTNRYFATSYQPFGVEVVRSYCYMDYEVSVNTTGDLRRHSSTSFFLFEENTTPIPKIQTRDDGETNFWFSFRNSLEFCNEVGGCLGGRRPKEIPGLLRNRLGGFGFVHLYPARRHHDQCVQPRQF